MGYRDSAAFVPRYSREEQAIVYGLTGGVPKYLEQFDDDELEKLRGKIDLLPMRAPAIALFSLGGFTPEVLAEDVLAIDLDSMYS